MCCIADEGFGRGAGGAGGGTLGFADSNGNVQPCKPLQHVHMPEIATAIAHLAGVGGGGAGVVLRRI
ncbi:MAG: hypothetical protein Q4G14_04545 [Paracoccus sp. (in: a-proteobacteria)]|uniref:hypothetical protein n=1 Tax=Paracoccus sp. TaxID=267 RepID=UPI0026DF5742|nr:hypothetical protein [Paracoccus sp. (in: a-proteobacteria)]MDO5612498.1 hypothetical protein [Paracoccus sp. (in: a-proteobacteria)]